MFWWFWGVAIQMFKHLKMRALSVLVTSLFCTVFLASVANAKSYRGETHSCFFPKAGKVLINTRSQAATITYKGRRYPASDGSYFYQADKGKISVMFNPSMTKWSFSLWSGDDSDEPKTEKAIRCTQRQNMR